MDCASVFSLIATYVCPAPKCDFSEMTMLSIYPLDFVYHPGKRQTDWKLNSCHDVCLPFAEVEVDCLYLNMDTSWIATPIWIFRLCRNFVETMRCVRSNCSRINNSCGVTYKPKFLCPCFDTPAKSATLSLSDHVPVFLPMVNFVLLLMCNLHASLSNLTSVPASFR